MLASINFNPQCRALQRFSTEVEGERDHRIELPVRQGYRDQPQHGSFGNPHVLTQKLSGLCLRNPRCELILFMCQNDMAIVDGRVAGWENLNGRTETFKPLDQVKAFLGDVTHQPPRRILLISRLSNQKDITAAKSAWVSSSQVACRAAASVTPSVCSKVAEAETFTTAKTRKKA